MVNRNYEMIKGLHLRKQGLFTKKGDSSNLSLEKI